MALKTPTKTDGYIRSLLPRDNRLSEIEAYALLKHVPILLPESAAFLRQAIILKKPKSVLEVGTGIGYSGHIILNSGAKKLHTIDYNESFLEKAAEFFEKSGLRQRVTLYLGNESEIIPLLKIKFDFIFLDGAKTRYFKHLPYFKSLLNPGGILLADNVLFNGMVLGETEAGGKRSISEALKKFLTALCADDDFVTSVLPVGDGISFSILAQL